MHIISYRLPVTITSDCDLNVSWRTKEKIQRITALLPWSPQFPLVKRSLILIFALVRWRVFDVHRLFEDRGSRIDDRGSLLYSCQHYCYRQQKFFHLFIYLLFIECQATCFKNSSYIFSTWERVWLNNRNVCSSQGGYLASIETEEEWQFINKEIQKRGTWNTSAWHIGLEKKGGVWTCVSGEHRNISKWRDSPPNSNDKWAEISKNGGLFNVISTPRRNAYICETPGGKITFQP